MRFEPKKVEEKGVGICHTIFYFLSIALWKAGERWGVLILYRRL